MKNSFDIQNEVNRLNIEVIKLNKAIKDCLTYQRENDMRITKQCDYIKGREERIAILESKIEGLKWVLN